MTVLGPDQQGAPPPQFRLPGLDAVSSPLDAVRKPLLLGAARHRRNAGSGEEVESLFAGEEVRYLSCQGVFFQSQPSFSTGTPSMMS